MKKTLKNLISRGMMVGLLILLIVAVAGFGQTGKHAPISEMHGYDPYAIAAETLGIEEGKRADFILINLSRLHLTPNAFVPRKIAFYATGNDVDTVIVDGLSCVIAKCCARTKAKSSRMPAEKRKSRSRAMTSLRKHPVTSLQTTLLLEPASR